ncbi:uncharacterized protein LOC115875992 [Sitophilus oryzae]|uniref:Uncharacterized protein LOC115875992 n=1 Tax=Sitophilus oryzae TaxID=7048 RepID=A0A6J2X944_SITOR|nr:uncharacterized protein LOC115875992 [Sitophilus oryzae]
MSFRNKSVYSEYSDCDSDPYGCGQNQQINTCSTCNKSFSIKLEDHLNTYSHISAIKNMFCHYCGVQFNLLSDLKNHQMESRDHQLKIIVRKLNHPLFKIEPEDPKEELELELQKLVYYLYYSNAFPYEVSLEYLKCYQWRMSSKGICQEGKKSVTIPLLEILKEDIEVLLESDEKANSTRIKVLQKMESLIILHKNLIYI